MLGAALRKFAATHQLKVDRGLAYGLYGGYLLTLHEGVGWKRAIFSAHFPSEEAEMTILSRLSDRELREAYRILDADVTDVMVWVTFHDQPGTMKRMEAFLPLLLEQLTQAGAADAQHCADCGEDFSSSPAVTVRIRDAAFRLHEDCIAPIAAQSEQRAQAARNTGSLATGTLGAFLGAIVGAIPWAVAYYFGWFVGWLGFLIGIAAKKGYEICHGKETRAKGIIVLIVVVLTVVLAEFGTYLVAWIMEAAAEPSLSHLSVGDIAQLLVDSILHDPQMRGYVLLDILMGWLFAGLGIFSLLREIFSRARDAEDVPVRLEP